MNKLINLFRRCLGGMPFFTIEKEEAFLRQLRNTLDDISFVVFAYVLIEPLTSVFSVESFLTILKTLVGVDAITECEDDAQVIRIALCYEMLENCHTVGVCSTGSWGLFENEYGQIDLQLVLVLLLSPSIDSLYPFSCQHVRVIESWRVYEVQGVKGKRFGFLRAPSSLQDCLKLVLRLSTHSIKQGRLAIAQGAQHHHSLARLVSNHRGSRHFVFLLHLNINMGS